MSYSVEYHPSITDVVAIASILDKSFDGAKFIDGRGERKANGFVRHTIIDSSGQRVGWVNFQHGSFYNFRPVRGERGSPTWRLFAAYCDTYQTLKQSRQWQNRCCELTKQLDETSKQLELMKHRKWYHLLFNLEPRGL